MPLFLHPDSVKLTCDGSPSAAIDRSGTIVAASARLAGIAHGCPCFVRMGFSWS